MKIDAPTFVSHKKVRALEIKGVGSYHYSAINALVRDITLVGHEGEAFEMPDTMFARYVPEPGDFLVLYEDGYKSFSPRKAFLEGYTLAHEGNVLMERLNDIATAISGTPSEYLPEWMRELDWWDQLSRVGREAYVTINSLKHQLETIQREKANDLQAGRGGSDQPVAGAAGVHPAAGAGPGDGEEG